MGIFAKKKLALSDVQPGSVCETNGEGTKLTIGGASYKCDDGFMGTSVVNKLLNGARDLKVKCAVVHATSYGKPIYKVYAVDIKGHKWHIGNLQERNEQILSNAKYDYIYVELIKGKEPVLHVVNE